MRLLNAHILTGNAARQWHTVGGKPRTFILCEKKREWVYSNASISLKNPLLVRVWSMRLSVKLHLCRLLFMQYKNTWLVRKHLCRLVEIRLKEATTHESLRTTVMWCWQVLLADPAIRGRATGEFPPEIFNSMFSWIYQLRVALLSN